MRIKHVFVCPDIPFLYLQYKDFNSGENRALIRIGENRKIVKGVSTAGFTDTKLLDPVIAYVLNRSFKNLPAEDGIKYCFILYSRTYEDFRSSICRYLREKYKNCLIAVYYGDLVSRHFCSISDVKKNCDAVFSFDSDDAKEHDLVWLLEPFSSSVLNLDIVSEKNNPIKWDVTFVGRAKNRYEKIIELYELLIDSGLKCDFHITGVQKNNRRYTDNIGYSALDFSDILRHVAASKCVAEIMQDKGISPTTRYTEAMLFNKNLLTDCKYFEKEMNRSPNIIYFNDVAELTSEMICETRVYHPFDTTPYVNMFSIDSMISNVDRILS